jgi:hypothetical protein
MVIVFLEYDFLIMYKPIWFHLVVDVMFILLDVIKIRKIHVKILMPLCSSCNLFNYKKFNII